MAKITIASGDLISNSRADINANFTELYDGKEDVANKSTDTALGSSNTLYPSQLAVKTYVDTLGGANASETVRGIVEEATDAEVTAGTATGATGAKLIVTPAKLATRLTATALNPVVRTYLVAGSPATWTKPSGLKYVVVEVIGGGAGGGSGDTTNGNAGGGGGGGGYSRKLIAVASLGTTETVTTGAAGTAGSVSVGGSGGTSSFGSHCQSTGGVGGSQNTGAGGAGGVGSSGDINSNGNSGGGGQNGSSSTSGSGGGSFFGAGAAGSGGGDFTGTTATAYGGGGAGGHRTASNQTGGVGFAGIVIVTEYYI